MKLDDRYELRVVVVEMRENRVPGDVYDDMCKFKEEHPHSGYIFGFCVVDTVTGFVPEGCNDWNDSPDEAVFDYQDNVVG